MPNNLKRLLIVHPHLSFFGGAEILIVHFVEELLKSGIEVKLVSLSVSEQVRGQLNAKAELILPKRKLSYSIRSSNLISALGILNEIASLRTMVERQLTGIDLINVHNFPSTWCVNRRWAKPVVWMCNETPELWNNPNPSLALKILASIGKAADKGKVLNNIDKIVVSDNPNYERVFGLYGIKPEIINYGVDVDYFSQAIYSDFRKKHSLQEAFIILQVGFFSPRKNQLQSVKVLSAVKNIIPNVKLIFAGQGGNDYEVGVKDYIRENGLEDYVIFLGHVDREKVRLLYKVSDIALFPSQGPGGWLSPLEAISAGITVIVNPKLPAAELIKENKLGYVSCDYAKTIELLFNQGNFSKMVIFVILNGSRRIFPGPITPKKC
jgi:glycosyltransferase involved in cell wall biosynthesis